MKHILLTEDDVDLGNILKQLLEFNKYRVTWMLNGLDALDFLKANTVSVCIIDVMMPKMDGFMLAENIIEIQPELPFLFLTARSQKEDRLRGLGLGADDYIVKPFEVDELLLRLKNILRRYEQGNSETKQQVRIGNYLLDYDRLILSSDSNQFRLTEREAKIIAYFHENRNKVIKRSEILMAIWKTDDYFTGRSFDVFLSRIRKYFSQDNSISITSVRNIGIEFKVLKEG